MSNPLYRVLTEMQNIVAIGYDCPRSLMQATSMHRMQKDYT